MGIGNHSRGWGHVDGEDEYSGGGKGGDGGGLTQEERLYRFRFSIPEPNPKPGKDGKIRRPNLVKPGSPATKRVLFLDGVPYSFFEHSLWNMRDVYSVMGAFTAPCLKRNTFRNEDGSLFDKGCPVCHEKGGNRFPAYAGTFTVIDMGQVEYIDGKVKLHHEPWENDKGERFYRKFQKVLLTAKRGSNDNPGPLKMLHFEMETLRREQGIDDLSGTVWDTTRMGKRSHGVGDKWRFVRKLNGEAEIRDYLVRFGAEEENLDLEIPVLDLEEPGTVFYVDPQKMYDKMCRLVGWGGSQSSERQRGEASGAGFDGEEDSSGGPEDDGQQDIPF